MIDKNKTYNLKMAATILGVSPAWINKIQGIFKIPTPIGTKGLEHEFSVHDLVTLWKIDVLRKFDFSLDDIKGFYDVEQTLARMEEKGNTQATGKNGAQISANLLLVGKRVLIQREYVEKHPERKKMLERHKIFLDLIKLHAGFITEDTQKLLGCVDGKENMEDLGDFVEKRVTRLVTRE